MIARVAFAKHVKMNAILYSELQADLKALDHKKALPKRDGLSKALSRAIDLKICSREEVARYFASDYRRHNISTEDLAGHAIWERPDDVMSFLKKRVRTAINVASNPNGFQPHSGDRKTGGFLHWKAFVAA